MFPLPSKHGVLAARDAWHGAVDENSDDDPEAHRWDLAETIFGRVGSKPDEALKGRVSFAAGLPDDPANVRVVDNPEATIRCLRNPALRQPIWRSKPEIQHLSAGTRGVNRRSLPVGSAIRFADSRSSNYPYGADEQSTVANPAEDDRSVRKCPVTFTSELRFHNLRRRELGAVLWAMTFGGDFNCHHSLGGGKPDGNGRVVLELDLDDWDSAVVANKIDDYDETSGTMTTAKAPSADQCKDDFVKGMERFIHANGLASSRNSPQIRTLLGLADVSRSDPPQTPIDHWQYMLLDDHANARANNWLFPRSHRSRAERRVIAADLAHALVCPQHIAKSNHPRPRLAWLPVLQRAAMARSGLSGPRRPAMRKVPR